MHFLLPKLPVFGGFAVLGLLAACSPKKADTPATAPPAAAAAVPPAAAAAPDSAATRLQVNDSANLSPQFLKGLRELSGSEAYKVRGKWLVLGADDSVAFPTELPAGKPVTYAGRQGGQTFTLTVTRLNYTSLRFAANLTGGKNDGQHAEGVAELNPGFYLGADTPEAAETQAAFGATEFNGTTTKGNFSVQIGTGKDADKATLFAYDATGKPLPQWQGAPTLRRLAL